VLREGRHPIPVIEFFRRSGAGDFDAVVYDEDVGAHDVVQHLLGLGHRRIGVIAGPRRLGSTGLRLRGAHRAVEEAGLSPRVLRVLHGEYTSEAGRSAFHDLVDHPTPPTAVFATSRQFVLGVILAAKERGIVIPGQLSLAGFGDPEWSQLVTPALTTYTLPLHEMVMTAAQLLISRIEDNEAPVRSHGTQIVVSGSLVVRSSTAPPMSGPTGSGPRP
jgi:LacI family transcriptional regulator